MLPRGSRVARYEIEEPLGEGAYGAVYRARDPVLGRTVAIKLLRAEAVLANSANRTRFVREGRAVAQLAHPNIVSVFDAGEAEGVAFIVMEFVPGRPLRQYVGNPEIPIGVRLGWLIDVARALSFSHQAGLVHRDIKPENVLVTQDNAIKVVDFGIARSTESELESTQLTREGQMVGTPLYMAPEQMFGDPADARCDQFSWGVMAFELLSGGLPWVPAGGVLTFVEAVNRNPPRTFIPLRGEVPRHVAAAVEKAISRRPEERHPSMGAVVAALTQRPSLAGVADPSNITVPIDPANVTASSIPPDPASHSGQAIVSAALRSPPSSSARSHRRPSSKAPLLVGAVALGLVAVTALALVVLHVRRSSAAAAPRGTLTSSASASASSETGMPITSAPIPDGRSEAIAQYRAALLALRQANWRDAEAALKAAVAADPQLGQAHIRIAYIQLGTSNEDVMRSYRAALAVREKLEPRDQALLDALTPVMTEPPDMSAFAHGLAASADRFPHDAEVQLFAAIQEEFIGEIDSAEKLVDRALAADPDYADAWQIRARLHIVKNHPKEARAAIDSCIRVAPSSIDCRLQLVWFDESSGACPDAEVAFKQALALQPHEGSLPLAGVLRQLERPRDAVEEATRNGIERLPTDSKPFYAPYTLASVHISYGELDKAQKALDAAESGIRDDRDGDYHAQLATRRALLYLEMGDVGRARQVLRRYLDARSAWATPRIDRDPLIFALLGGDIQGALTREAKAPLPMRRFYWALGTVGITDRNEAIQVLGERPEVSPQAAYESHRFGAAAIEGRLLTIAGRAPEAIPLLDSTARHCSLFEEPLLSTQSQLWLGEAHEQNGETQAACEAYGTVVDRWAHAKPRSVSAEEATKRWRALHCGPR